MQNENQQFPMSMQQQNAIKPAKKLQFAIQRET